MFQKNVLAHFREAQTRGPVLENEWNQILSAYSAAYPELSVELDRRLKNELPENWEAAFPFLPSRRKRYGNALGFRGCD